MNKTITEMVLTRSLKPYLIILGFSLTALLLGMILNSATLGSLYGASLASLHPRYDPIYAIGVILIYFIRRPYLAIFTTLIFSIIYNPLFVDSTRELMGLPALGFSVTPRFLGGVMLLSIIGSVHFLVRVGNK